MTTRTIEVKNSIGLHAAPASFFVQEACSFQSSIWVEKGDRRVNGKSLLGLLSMGFRQGEMITIHADGADEVAALDGLEELLLHRLAD